MAFNKAFVISLLLPIIGWSQPPDTSKVSPQRIRILTIGGAAGYTAALAGLSHLWYADSESQSFRFFNDNAEWKQVDKVGHFFSSFYFSYGSSKALQWSGVKKNKADLIGSLAGFGVLLPIEILDGFSDAYGASSGDLIANAAGSAFYLGQQRLWDEVRIHPKFSFHRTHYPELRPDLLGDNLISEIIKDYNGQTFWLSVDMDKFVRFPKWLNFAVGYGAQGMIYARDSQNLEAGFERPYRQYYLGIDFDLTAIQSRSKVVNTLIFLANMIKLPSPTLEFSAKGTRFHTLYF